MLSAVMTRQIWLFHRSASWLWAGSCCRYRLIVCLLAWPRDSNWLPVRAVTVCFCHAWGQVIIAIIPLEWCHLICQYYRETSHVVYTGHNPLYKADFNFFFVICHELHWIKNRNVAAALFMSKRWSFLRLKFMRINYHIMWSYR